MGKSATKHGEIIPEGDHMLKAAITFFILGLIAMLFGANGIGGLSVEIGKTLLFVFLILAVISFVVSMVAGKKMIGKS